MVIQSLTSGRMQKKKSSLKLRLNMVPSGRKKGSTEDRLLVLNYKKEMRSQEVAQLEEKIENLQSELHTVRSEIKEVQTKKIKMQSVDDISEKHTMLDERKIIVPKADFDEIKVWLKSKL